LNSPSYMTNCGKSVVSLFSQNSGKTNHSAPLNNSNTFSDSPKYQSKFAQKNEKVLADKTKG